MYLFGPKRASSFTQKQRVIFGVFFVWGFYAMGFYISMGRGIAKQVSSERAPRPAASTSACAGTGGRR